MYYDDMFPEEEEETQIYAFMVDSEEIIEYREVLSPELKDKYHKDIIGRGREFVGLGYICGYDTYGNLWCMPDLDLIYI